MAEIRADENGGAQDAEEKDSFDLLSHQHEDFLRY